MNMSNIFDEETIMRKVLFEYLRNNNTQILRGLKSGSPLVNDYSEYLIWLEHDEIK